MTIWPLNKEYKVYTITWCTCKVIRPTCNDLRVMTYINDLH